MDIYVPSKKLIIECFGNYWHCNPNLYKPDYYHKNVKLTAEQIWLKDNERIEYFKKLGYQVKIVWET